MSGRWLGIVVSGDRITVVDVEVPDHGPLILQSDQSWPLQAGDRSRAYHVMHQRVADYVREHGIARTVIKASAVSQGKMGWHIWMPQSFVEWSCARQPRGRKRSA